MGDFGPFGWGAANMGSDPNAGWGSKTTHATANTWSTWERMDAVLDNEANGFQFFIGHNNSTGADRHLWIQIGCGDISGGEIEPRFDLIYNFNNGRGYGGMTIPGQLPVGEEIGFRIRSNRTSETFRWAATYFNQGGFTSPPPHAFLSRIIKYGNPTVAIGVQHTWAAQNSDEVILIDADTDNPIKVMWLCVGANLDDTKHDFWTNLNISIGASGQEEDIVKDIFMTVNDTTNEILPAIHGPFFVNVPVGERLTVHGQTEGLTGGDTLANAGIDVCIMGGN